MVRVELTNVTVFETAAFAIWPHRHMAEEKGFEPLCRFRLTAFQAGQFDRSCTLPYSIRVVDIYVKYAYYIFNSSLLTSYIPITYLIRHL